MANKRVPRVFISYSHDSARHQERVLDLADRLRADGIDAEIDQYNPAPPEGWPLWCERQIAGADTVLMVCTETYRRRVMGEEEPGQGLGVVWEARIIRQLLYDAGAVSDKVVPVLFSDGSPEHTPTPIKAWSRYVADTGDGYEALYRRLTGQPLTPRPELGAIRALPPRPRQWTSTRSKAAEAQSEETERASPSSSAADPTEEGSVAAGDDRRKVVVGGNMVNSAAVFGNHNVTNISPAPDKESIWRQRLHEFSQSAEYKSIARDLRAERAAEAKGRAIATMLMCVFCGVFALALTSGNHTGWSFTFIAFFCFFWCISLAQRITAAKAHDYDANIFPAIILSIRANLADKTFPWIVFLEKLDGSRISLLAINRLHQELEGDIGVAEASGNALMKFKRWSACCGQDSSSSCARAPRRPSRRRRGLLIFMANIALVLIGGAVVGEETLWSGIFILFVVAIIPAYSIYLMIAG